MTATIYMIENNNNKNIECLKGGIGLRRYASREAHDPRDPFAETVRPRQRHPHRRHAAAAKRREVQGRLHGAG